MQDSDFVMEADDHSHSNIIKFFDSNDKEHFIQDLYQEWTKMIEDVLAIGSTSVQKIRQDLSSWFIQCYLARNDVRKLPEVSNDMAATKAAQLYKSFCEQMKKVVQDENIKINKIALDGVMKVIESIHSPKEWVEKAIECVDCEIKLMEKYTKVKQDTKQLEENHDLDERVKSARDDHSNVKQCMKKLTCEIENLRKFIDVKLENEQLLKNLNGVLNSEPEKKRRNGNLTPAKSKGLMETVKKNKQDIDTCHQRVKELNKNVLDQFHKLEDSLTEVIAALNIAVIKWKENFKLNFVELASLLPLNGIENRCAQIGRLLDELLQDDLPNLDNSFNYEFRMEVIDNIPKECVQFQTQFTRLLQDFLQSTFLVTEQESCIIKKDKKYLPKIVLRILAAGMLVPPNTEITPMFLCEDYINACCENNWIDFDKMQERNKKFGKDVKVSFTAGKRDPNRKFEACFQNLIYDKKIERMTGKAVHEEKYRILFQTSLYGRTYWTMSLPLVVTTGANQGCLSQGSVLWQCYGTDVYTLPIKTRDQLAWKEVAEMLNKKILYLCPSNGLSADNICHLKKRLFGSADKSDEEMVSLKRFCFIGMSKPDSPDSQDVLEFSFWKWFVGIYNLIEKYLKDYWNDKLIHGFISKEDARQLLGHCNRSGTFILRFSDSHMLQSQGYKSMFGCLTACLMVITENKRTGEKVKMCHDMDVAGSKMLENHNLANILCETRTDTDKNLYMYLYPGNKTRKELFDKYCEKDTVVDGYTGSRDAFVVDLEQQLCKLQIQTGKHRSMSQDSGFDGESSPQPIPQFAAAVKKQRCSVTNDHPTMVNILSRNQKYQQDHLATPLQSPAPSSPASQSYSYPSPASYASSPVQFGLVPVASPQASVPTTVTEISQEVSHVSRGKNIPHSNRSLTKELTNRNSRQLYQSNGNHVKDSIAIHSPQYDYDEMDSPSNSQRFFEDMETATLVTGRDPVFTSVTPMQPEFSDTIITVSDSDSSSNCISQGSLNETFVFVQKEDNSIVIKDIYQPSAHQQEDVQLVETVPVVYSHDQFGQNVPVASIQHPFQMISQVFSQYDPAAQQQLLAQLNQLLANSQHFPVIVDEQTPVMASPLAPRAQYSSGIQLSSGDFMITSSGGISDTFNFSTNEIAEGQAMNSGTIETGVFDEVE